MDRKNFIYQSRLTAQGNIHIGDIYRIEKREVRIPLNLNTIPSLDTQKYLERKKIVENITGKLKNTDSPLVIYGIGGIGKTTICRFIASELRDNFNYILWVSVVNGIPVAFANDAELTNNLHLSFEDTQSPDYIFLSILTRLKNLKESSKVNLLIVDNVEQDLLNRINSKLIYDLLQVNNHWSVLITTRNVYSSFESVKLDDFSLDDAKKLFLLYAKDEDKYDNHLVEDFVKIVGYHPLTIELIAKTLASSNLISLSDLLQMFEEKGIRFEGQNQIEMPSYERVEKTTTTFKCLSVAFDISSFEKEGHVVEILSVFAIAPVSGFLFDELLIYISRINQFKIDETIQTLLRKGWLSYFGNRIIMHPVIQEVLRIKLSVNIKSCHFYIANVLSAIKESKTKRYNVLDTNKHISFAIAAFDHLYKDIDFATVDDLALSKIGLSIGEYFFEHSDYNRALKYELKSLKILRKLYGEFDLGLKDILNNIAETYAFLGEYDKSLEYHERCLEIKLKLSPSDSEGIAASLNNLGNLYYYKDSYEMAVQCFKEALDKWKECGNEFHLSSTMTNLGLNYYYLNNHEDAILYHKQAIEINEKIMGSDHPDLGRSYFGIVPSLISVGNFDGAEEYLTKAKNIFEKVFEPSHDLIADVNDWFLSIAKAREEKSRDES